MIITRIKLLVLLLPLLLSCSDFPRDAEGTLNRIKSHREIRVGIIDGVSHPQPLAWYRREIDLVKEFAARLDSKTIWIHGTQSSLLELLNKHELDIAIGGYTEDSPLKSEAAFTKPYTEERITIGVYANEPLPEKIKGLTIVVTDAAVAAYVKSKEALPVIKNEISDTDRYAAGPERALRAMNRQVSDITLHTERRVIAVPKGENALLVEVEKFIADYESK